MRLLKYGSLACLLGAFLVVGMPEAGSQASAQYYGRHYYGGWRPYSSYNYYYNTYYYKPYPQYTGYRYHYAIYYPSYPRYVYYYSPYSGKYWGRYDLQAEGENKYSLLKEEDRKADLKDIPESAFPKPGKMPPLPEAKDGEQMAPPPAPPKEPLKGQ